MRPETRTIPGLAGALPELESSLAEDDSPRNVMKVADAFWLTGRCRQAIRLLETLIDEHPAAISPRVLLGWCYEDTGRGEDAQRVFAAARELDPANPYARHPDGAADPARPGAGREEGAPSPEGGEREAEPERALTEEELRGVPPDPLYSATLAEMFGRQGFEGKAIEIYRELLRNYPDRRDFARRIEELSRREPEGGEA
jgi:tetratricopeptide (TPR) repeat protein